MIFKKGISARLATLLFLFSMGATAAVKKLDPTFVPTTNSPAHTTERIRPAGAAQISTRNQQLPLYKRLQFEPRIVASQYEYKEPGIMKMTGTMYGVGIDSKLKKLENWGRAGAQAEYLQGNLKYEGALSNGDPFVTHKEDYIVDLRGYWENEMVIPDSTQNFAFSAGLAYRYLNDNKTVKESYEREQTYLYAPLTVSVSSKIGTHLEWSLGGEFDLFLAGKNVSHMGNQEFTFKQNSGSGTKLSAAVKTNQFFSTNLKTELFYREWSIGASDKVGVTDEDGRSGYLYEPKNTTKMTGVAVSAVF